MGEHNCCDEQECIRNQAYKLWEKDGCKQGFDLDYWLIAEERVNRLNNEISDPNSEQWKQNGGWQPTHSVEAKNQSFFRHLGRM